MTLEQCIATLKHHNQWRRGDEDLEMLEPKIIGEAIDTAIEFLEKLKDESYT